MPYPLVFLVLPIVFPSNIRNSLPERTDREFDAWTKEKSLELLKFDEIVSFLDPYTKEAIIFAIQFGLFGDKKWCIATSKISASNKNLE